jgi:hypothetical protein
MSGVSSRLPAISMRTELACISSSRACLCTRLVTNRAIQQLQGAHIVDLAYFITCSALHVHCEEYDILHVTATFLSNTASQQPLLRLQQNGEHKTSPESSPTPMARNATNPLTHPLKARRLVSITIQTVLQTPSSHSLVLQSNLPQARKPTTVWLLQIPRRRQFPPCPLWVPPSLSSKHRPA